MAVEKSSCFAGLLPTCQQNVASVPTSPGFHCSQQELKMVKVLMARMEPSSLRPASHMAAVHSAFIAAPGMRGRSIYVLLIHGWLLTC